MQPFEELYLQHFDGVRKYVLSLCGDPALAEEITQEAFFRAMEHLDRFQGRCGLFVWLCQIAKNTLFTYWKKQKREVALEDLPLPPAPGPEDALLDKESVWRLHRLVHRLEEPYKEVFSLRVFGELPFSQIGALFEKSDSWARLIFFRAKQQLRRAMDEADM